MMRKISKILMRDTHGDLVTIKITKKRDLTITEKIIIMSSESESEASISEHFCFVISKVVRTFICILKCSFFANMNNRQTDKIVLTSHGVLVMK